MLKKRNIIFCINYLITVYIMIYTISPPLQKNFICNLIVLLMFFFWILSSIVLKPEFYKNQQIIVFILILNFFLSTIFLLVTKNFSYWKLNLNIFIYYFIVIIFCFYKKYYSEKIYRLVIILLMILPIWNLITINALSKNNFIVRGLHGDIEYLYSKGIGGYFLVYASSFIFIIFFEVLINNSSLGLKSKLLIIFNEIIMGVLIIMSGFSTAILIIVFYFLIIFLRKKSYLQKISIIKVLILILIFIIFTVNINTILDILMERTKGYAYNVKINDLKTFVETGNLGESIVLRVNQYMVSINSFLENPILGIIKNGAVELNWYNYGRHSSFLDYYAMFGIFMGSLNVIGIIAIPYSLNKNGKQISKIILIITIFLALINNLTPSIACANTFVLYFAINNIRKKEN